MAGKRQHYVPRFLQRGFLDNSTLEAERTWLHRRGAPARLVGIRDVGVGEYFYSKLGTGGARTLDDLITDLEGPLDQEIKALRTMPIDQTVDAAVAARLTAHLAMRTAHMRSVFAQGAGDIVEAMAGLFGDAEALRGQLGVDAPKMDARLEKAMDEALSGLPFEALGVPAPLMRRFGAYLLRENFATFYDEHGPTITAVMGSLLTEIPERIREAHNRALQDPGANQRETDMAAFVWRLQAAQEAILPDCVALVEETGGEFAPLLLGQRDEVERVILPITHDRLLIGERTPGGTLDVDAFKLACAASSESFFVARIALDDAGLAEQIGQRSGEIIRKQIGEALAEFRSPRAAALVEGGGGEARVATQTVGSFSYTMSIHGDLEDAAVTQINEILKDIVGEMARSLPLDSLDGVTFTFDYPATLAQLDRGDPNLPPVVSEPRGYGIAVSRVVGVVRDGVAKRHIVVNAGIGLQMLSDDQGEREEAFHVLAAQLADLAHDAAYISPMEGQRGTPADSVVFGLYQTASSAPSRYFSARESAFVDPSYGEDYAMLVRDSWAVMKSAVEPARAAFFADRDFDALFAAVLPPLRNVIGHVAEWLGHRDGLPEQDDFPGASLLADFKALELSPWLDLFGRDLRELHDVDGHFTPDNIFALGRQVERLLWTIGILLWPNDEDVPQVLVLPDEVPALGALS